MVGAKPTAASLDFTPFDAAVNHFIERHNASVTGAGALQPIVGGSAVVVTADAVLHTQGYGRYAADRLYLIASSSKLLSAGVLLRLVDQRKLRLEEPIRTYLQHWPDSKAGDITLAQLLSNSSGLPSLNEVSATLTNLKSPYVKHLMQFVPQGTLQDCALLLYQTEPLRAPNVEFAYGGSQWQLAGALAEVVSGKTWAELIRETYIEPCGVASLGYTNPFLMPPLRGYPRDFDGVVSKLPVTDNPNIEGGAYIRAPDYAKLLQMHLKRGMCGDVRVLSTESIATMQLDWVAKYGGKPVSPSPIRYGDGYGLGWWINHADGSLVDPGSYGAFAWLDVARGYAAITIIENGVVLGGELGLSVKPVLDGIFDQRVT